MVSVDQIVGRTGAQTSQSDQPNVCFLIIIMATNTYMYFFVDRQKMAKA